MQVMKTDTSLPTNNESKDVYMIIVNIFFTSLRAATGVKGNNPVTDTYFPAVSNIHLFYVCKTECA